MKQLLSIFLLSLSVPVTVTAEVIVKEEPLTWDKTARLSGDQMYQNLCVACHDSDGSGNGMASAALGATAPDLTKLAANNGGMFPQSEIEQLIANSDIRNPHAGSPMPVWEQQFKSVYFKTARNPLQRDAYARDRIRELASYVQTIQQPN